MSSYINCFWRRRRKPVYDFLSWICVKLEPAGGPGHRRSFRLTAICIGSVCVIEKKACMCMHMCTCVQQKSIRERKERPLNCKKSQFLRHCFGNWRKSTCLYCLHAKLSAEAVAQLCLHMHAHTYSLMRICVYLYVLMRRMWRYAYEPAKILKSNYCFMLGACFILLYFANIFLFTYIQMYKKNIYLHATSSATDMHS